MSLRSCQCRLFRQISTNNNTYTRYSSSYRTIRALHGSRALNHDKPSSHQPFSSAAQSSTKDNTKPKRGLRFLKNIKEKGNASKSSSTSQRMILGQSADEPIRARFAPSPTGYLHLGSLRTALFNSITASATKSGSFILRIEDTDQNRLVADAEDRLLEDLKWAGLHWHEGPDCGGPHGPYRQSERLPIYEQHIEKLLDSGHAYRCFCTSEQLELQKQELHEAGQPTIYPGTCRSIDTDESTQRAKKGESHVIRFKSDTTARHKLRDAIYGPFQKKDAEEDFILVKTDGFPTYHFANVVDDHLMKITHVIRGEEWLISTPKHIALYEAFGWKPPTFAHLGLLVNPDGTKLSKRNDSVNLSHYKDGPVMPQSLLMWLANLGSSFRRDASPPRNIQAISDSLTFKFTRGGIKLNWEKLDHFNKQYRDTLLQSTTELSSTETDHLDHHVIQPLLKSVAEDSQGRQPVPLMSPVYIHKLLTLCTGAQDPSALLTAHAYLFFRPSQETYNAVAKEGDQRVLDVLQQVVSMDECWTDNAEESPMEALKRLLEPQGVDMLTTHNVIRLVGAGGVDVVSQSSGKMFSILGQQEWKQRQAMVQKAMT